MHVTARQDGKMHASLKGLQAWHGVMGVGRVSMELWGVAWGHRGWRGQHGVMGVWHGVMRVGRVNVVPSYVMHDAMFQLITT